MRDNPSSSNAKARLRRLNNKADGAIVLVMQRLHEDDLVGAVLEREPWEVLTLPAIAMDAERLEYETVFGPRIFERKADEALHPERDSLDTYKAVRESIGEYHFQSQYQQTPIPREGGFLKRNWLRFYSPEEKPSEFRIIVQSWDTANKAERMNDFSVCTTWKIFNKNYYLLHVYRQRLDFPALKRVAKDLYDRFTPRKVVIEDKASGTALVQELQLSDMYGVEAYQPASGSNKQMRFATQTIKFEQGQVLLPSKAPWLDEYLAELTGFPGAKFDDQVDSTSQALDFMGSACKLTIYDVL